MKDQVILNAEKNRTHNLEVLSYVKNNLFLDKEEIQTIECLILSNQIQSKNRIINHTKTEDAFWETYTLYKLPDSFLLITNKLKEILDEHNFIFENNFQDLEEDGFRKVSSFHSSCFSYRKKNLNFIPKKINNFGLLTLFKHESDEWIKFFVSYYKKEGVDRFVFLYHGKLNDRPTLPLIDGVEYVEWDINLHINNHLNLKNMPGVHQYTWKHPLGNAQAAAFQLYRYKYLDTCKYICLTDLDEFLYVNDANLNLLQLVDLQFKKEPATQAVKVQSAHANLDNETFFVKEMELERPKYIINTETIQDKTEFLELHNFRGNVAPEINNLYMFHLAEVLHPDRFSYKTESNCKQFKIKK